MLMFLSRRRDTPKGDSIRTGAAPPPLPVVLAMARINLTALRRQ